MDEQTFKNLRDALNNLYDSEHLRGNPLAKVFGLSGRNDTPLAMQKALENLIEALKPKPGDTGRAQKRRIYDLLYSRYVEQFSQKEVADQLGISLSTYQREQRTALEFLAAVLAEKYPAAAQEPGGEPALRQKEAAPGLQSAPVEEFSWMFAPDAEKISELFAVVASARQLVQPLLQRYKVDLQISIDQHLPKVAVHPEALLQIFINLLSVAVHQAAYGAIELAAKEEDWETTISIRVRLDQQAQRELSEADQACLEVAEKLIGLAGGSLILSRAPALINMIVRLPALESLPILVIDDSADNIRLLGRYLVGTRYQMSSLDRPEQALELIESTRPQIVILDLMMPGVDGLEILTRLHSNPATCQIPIIVCTILPQEELALSLGASAFLQKPVMQNRLLAVLDHLASERETGSG
jgi:CheY-like chemotaxis protein